MLRQIFLLNRETTRHGDLEIPALLIRRLNNEGIEEFERFLKQLTNQGTNRDCSYLLSDSVFTEPLPIGEVAIDPRSFVSRRDFAVYIDSRFEAAGITNDVDIFGMWEWLSGFYFDQLIPRGRSVGTDLRRFIVNSSVGRRSHRHLLRNPYMLYRKYRSSEGGELDLLLCDELWNHGDVVEGLSARARLVNSPAALRVARRLYFDPDTGKSKIGTRSGEGGHRSFSRFLRNLPSEFDLSRVSDETILQLLPPAFVRWYDPGAEIGLLFDSGESFDHGVGPNVDQTEIKVLNSLELAHILQNVDSRTLSTSQRRIRHDFFRAGVLGAYENRCAISRIGLVHTERNEDVSYEVEASHVIPVARGGRDLVPNGLALNRSLHWAFDLGMMWIDADYRVNVSLEVQNDQRNEWLRGFEGRKLWLPNDARLVPSREALCWHAEQVAIR